MSVQIVSANAKPRPWDIQPDLTAMPSVWERMVWATPFLQPGFQQELVKKTPITVDASLGWRPGNRYGLSPNFAGGSTQLIRLGNVFAYPADGKWTAVACARYNAAASFQGLLGKYPSDSAQRNFSMFMDTTQTLGIRNHSGGSSNSVQTVPAGFYIFAATNHSALGGANNAAYAIEIFTGRVMATVSSYGTGGASDLTATVTIGDIERHFGAWQSDLYYAFTAERYWSLQELIILAQDPFGWIRPKVSRFGKAPTGGGPATAFPWLHYAQMMAA